MNVVECDRVQRTPLVALQPGCFTETSDCWITEMLHIVVVLQSAGDARTQSGREGCSRCRWAEDSSVLSALFSHKTGNKWRTHPLVSSPPAGRWCSTGCTAATARLPVLEDYKKSCMDLRPLRLHLFSQLEQLHKMTSKIYSQPKIMYLHTSRKERLAQIFKYSIYSDVTRLTRFTFGRYFNYKKCSKWWPSASRHVCVHVCELALGKGLLPQPLLMLHSWG